jgi:hypothetical protein
MQDLTETEPTKKTFRPPPAMEETAVPTMAALTSPCPSPKTMPPIIPADDYPTSTPEIDWPPNQP